MTRRTWIRKTLLALAGALAAWPVLGFVLTKRYRPPKKIRLRERVPAGGFIMEPEFVLFEPESGPLAVSRTCTHLGCTVTYDEAKRQFICPCHQSMFQWDGKYLSGPAKKDLPRFPVKITDDGKGYIVLV